MRLAPATEIPPSVGPPLVFLGPSLPLAEAALLVDAEFHLPIRRGDLAWVELGRTVLIVDGEFDQSFSVSPNEILRLLDGGSTVVGASSMGALRAAELFDEGMIGLGRIFEAYRSGRIEGDDEVALAYCPIDLTPHTVPLVNVRFWLDRLLALGWISPFERASLLRKARRVFYADRTLERLTSTLEAGLGAVRMLALREAGLGEISDAKSDDARAALSAVARACERFPT